MKKHVLVYRDCRDLFMLVDGPKLVEVSLDPTKLTEPAYSVHGRSSAWKIDGIEVLGSANTNGSFSIDEIITTEGIVSEYHVEADSEFAKALCYEVKEYHV